jgi:hypothetical protein
MDTKTPDRSVPFAAGLAILLVVPIFFSANMDNGGAEIRR